MEISERQSMMSLSEARPRVSVIIPVHNGEDTVARAIDSALSQTYKDNVEVIVINNGSTDQTAKVLESYAERIIILDEPALGVARARNTGVAAARGKYLAFLDADDEWMPEKLARVVPLLEADPECVLAYHDGIITDTDGTVIRESACPAGHDAALSLESLIKYSGLGLPILFDSVVLRRDIFDRVGGFNEQLESAEDVWLQINAREIGHFRYLPEALMKRQQGISPSRENWYIAGAYSLRSLIRERYGSKVDSRHLEVVLKWAALEALRRDERSLARRRYLAATIQRPVQIKGWLALIATFLPSSLISTLAPVQGRAIS
ncbi:MAG: glycosyltransferase family 2 protein [Candidatus Binataceae bacterium]